MPRDTKKAPEDGLIDFLVQKIAAMLATTLPQDIRAAQSTRYHVIVSFTEPAAIDTIANELIHDTTYHQY